MSAGERFARAAAAADVLRQRFGSMPTIAVILGSGLGSFSDRLRDRIEIACGDVPGWPVPTVAGHPGRIVAGQTAGRRVVVLAGRVHLYEGRSPDEVAFATRALARAGVRHLVLTNAAGGINPQLRRGTLMVIDDHINMMGANPLVGSNDPDAGPRFPDMTTVYSRRLRDVADAAASASGVGVAHGVYVAVTGPSYETPAEIRAFRSLGADAVGMSTVPEALAARHLGMEVLAISCITNPAAGIEDATLSEQDVVDVASRTREPFGRLLEAIIARI